MTSSRLLLLALGAALMLARPLAASDTTPAPPAPEGGTACLACAPAAAPAAPKKEEAACCDPAPAGAPAPDAPAGCCPAPEAVAPAAPAEAAALPATVERDAAGVLTITVPTEADAEQLATGLGFDVSFDNPYDDGAAEKGPYIPSFTPQEIAALNTTVGAFELLDAEGAPFTQERLAGRAWVADFIFTRCNGPCPAMSATMAKLHRAVRAEGLPVEFVTISVDPDYDTPEVMKRYAGWFGAGAGSGWHFLTGDYGTIARLANDVLGVGLMKYGGHHDAEQFPGRMMSDPIPEVILHSQRFVLMDGAGVVRGFYQGSEPTDTERLLRDLRAMAPAR